MSVFGDLDMANVPDDPFFIPEDNYWAVCTEASTKEKDGITSLVIKWTIDEPESQYHNMSLSEWYGIPSEGESFADWYENLDGKGKMRFSFLKKRLRGAFDLSEADFNQLEDWNELVGAEAYLKVTNASVGDKKFSNVGDAISRRRYDEDLATEEEPVSSGASPFDGI